jgi:hypothetical protein
VTGGDLDNVALEIDEDLLWYVWVVWESIEIIKKWITTLTNTRKYHNYAARISNCCWAFLLLNFLFPLSALFELDSSNNSKYLSISFEYLLRMSGQIPASFQFVKGFIQISLTAFSPTIVYLPKPYFFTDNFVSVELNSRLSPKSNFWCVKKHSPMVKKEHT